jgi:hypothetical protein
MTNLLILVPEVPQEAATVATSDAWGTSIRLNELNNNRCGERYNLAALNTAKTGTALISYDVGASKTKTIDHLAIARADLLANDSTTGVLVRGARQSRFAPSVVSGLKLWLDANLSVTTVSGAVSQWDDLSGSGNHATQGTAGNRPYLTSAGNKENETSYSNVYTNAEWNKSTYSVTAVDNFTTNYLGQSTAGKITASAGTGARGIINASTSLYLPVGGQVIYSVDVKKSNYSYLWIGDQSDSPWHGVTFNLDTGAFIGNGNLIDSKSVVSLGSGWYRVSVTYTSTAGHNPSSGVWFSVNADRTSPPSITAAGTEEFYLARPSIGRTNISYYSDVITGWTATSATINDATRLTISATNGRVTQDVGVISGQVYTLSAKIKAISGNTSINFRHVGASSSLSPITITGASATYTTSVTATTANLNIGIQDTNGSGFGQIEITEIRLERVGVVNTDTTYFDTTDAIIAGVNSNKTTIFDGSSDNLQTTLAVNPTGGMWAAFVVEVRTTTAIDSGIISSIGAAQRLRVFIGAGGTIFARVHNAANYIGRSAPAATITANVSAVITITYDGGTASSGIKIYKNGVQVDNADSASGVYTVPTAGAVLVIGELSAGDRLRGNLGELIFGQGVTISAGDRAKIEEYLIDKWTLPAMVGDFSFAANAGQNTEDYLRTFTTSSAFRYWWVELTNNASKKFTHSKLFIGQSVDLGDTIEDISCIKEVQSSSNYQASSGAIDSSRSYDDPYIIRITWRGITDTQLNDFTNRVGKNNAARKGMFLATVDNHDVLDGLKCIYVKLKSYSVNDQIKNNYNSLTAEFEEIVG